MPENKKDEQYNKQSFDRSKERMRITGAGGVLMPNPDSASVQSHIAQEPARHVSFDPKTGCVTIGSAAIKSKMPSKNQGSLRIFDYGQPKEDPKKSK